jgi:blue light- and temperature-responsive anti-repressor
LNSDLYKLVYCSRNEIRGTSEEVADAPLSLLASAQSKNQSLNIRGPSSPPFGVFAQVLEGPQNSVEQLFSLIQLDDRNSGVTVALRGPEEERDFPGWSMAFADREKTAVDREATCGLSLAQAAINAVFANQEGAGEQLLATLVLRSGVGSNATTE